MLTLSKIFYPGTEAYSEPCQTSKMELFENSFQPLITFAKRSILDV